MILRNLLKITSAAALSLSLATALVPVALAQGAEETITVAIPSDVNTLDVTLDTSPIGQNVRLNVFDQMTQMSRDGQALPRLASSWKINDDATEWVFTIRDDAKWHDGSPVTIDDIIFTYDKIMHDDKSNVRPYLSKIKSMEKLSDTELKITLIEPFAPFDRQLALVSIVPQAVYEKLGSAGFSTAPVGSGPYKLVRWVKDDHIEMVANPDYWGGEPEVKRVILRPIPAEASRSSALLTGEVDLVPLLPPQLADGLAGRSGIEILKVPSHKVVYIGYDVRNGVLGDEEFRRAVDMSIDREAITEQLLRGLGVPAAQIVTPASFGYDPSLEPTRYDPEGAKAALARSSYKGETIAMQYASNNVASNDQVAQAIAGYMQAVGINVELQGMEYTAFFPLWIGRKLNQMHLFSYGPTNLDADLPLTSLYETGRTRGYWEDPEIDALVREQRAQSDPEKRKEVISRIWKITRDKVIYTTVYNETHVWGVGPRVSVEPRADGLLRFMEISLKK